MAKALQRGGFQRSYTKVALQNPKGLHTNKCTFQSFPKDTGVLHKVHVDMGLQGAEVLHNVPIQRGFVKAQAALKGFAKPL